MTAREKNLVRRAEKFAMVDDVRSSRWTARTPTATCTTTATADGPRNACSASWTRRTANASGNIVSSLRYGSCATIPNSRKPFVR